MLQAREHLAQQMRNPGLRLPATEVQHPFPEYRGVDEAPAPESAIDPRELVAELAQRLMRDERDLTKADRHQTGIQTLEMQALKVGHVTGDMEAQDLPAARASELEPTGCAIEDHAAS